VGRNPRWDKVPGFVFNLFPHRWDDQDFLPVADDDVAKPGTVG
jgi:hypothetical protein